MVYVCKALLAVEQVLEANVMTITVESLYSPPEAWNMQTTGFVTALPLPLTLEVGHYHYGHTQI